MDGTQVARYRLCKDCPADKSTLKASEGWWRCFEPGGVLLDEAALAGPETTCPLGYWTDLAPVDLEQEAFESRQRARQFPKVHEVPALQALITWALGQFAYANVGAQLVALGRKAPRLAWPILGAIKALATAGTVPAAAPAAYARAVLTAIQADEGNDRPAAILLDMYEEGLLTGAEALSIANDLGLATP